MKAQKIQPRNPFLVYGYASPRYFCDREAETQQILSALENERNLTLIAPRRMGKTGLIKMSSIPCKSRSRKLPVSIWIFLLRAIYPLWFVCWQRLY